MRITKKFARDTMIGRQVYQRAVFDGSTTPAAWKAAWLSASNRALDQFYLDRAGFFAQVLAVNSIDLHMIVPDRERSAAVLRAVSPL